MEKEEEGLYCENLEVSRTSAETHIKTRSLDDARESTKLDQLRGQLGLAAAHCVAVEAEVGA